ncbi:sugar phosphate nucleotidyltransferase [uncultured Ilumatobacter sp.]|uniref:sugar phosphate nucleotidyltransferase n=2 Tax=Ilumatobacter TaxID=682522 RepID=UPI002A5F8B55|nr:NDP-sugar synthase [Ilumatobacter sp.]MDG1785813.1 NDP-sugar synthase [Ilumatobacter sp.]
MRAVVLVGGFGTRLRPLTNNIPKPMLPIGHRPMIERLVNRLGRGGVTEVVLALGFKPEPFMEAFPGGRCGDVKLTYAVEPAPLDTGGAIKFAANEAGIDSTFVVANGDVLTDLDVGELVAAHRRREAEATLHLIGVEDPSAFGVVALGDSDRITDFVEKPAPGTEPSNLINAGTYVFEPSVLDRIPDNERVSIERSTFPLLVEAGCLYGHATQDYWIDAGRPDLYRAANLDLLVGGRVNDHCEAVSRTATVDAAAIILNSIIGDDAVVAPGARIVDSVLLPGAHVGSAATVEASLVMGRVGEGARVDASMVGADGVVADGAVLTAGTVPEVPAS